MGAAVQIRRHVDEAHPWECCGLLLGRDGRIVELVSSPNVASDPTSRFEIDPALLLATHRRARGEGLTVLGPYHSHPTGQSAPSPRDVADAQIGQIWIIARPGALAAWRFGETGFDPVDLVILP